MTTIAAHIEAQDARFGALPATWTNPQPKDLVGSADFLDLLRSGEYENAIRWCRGSNHSDVKDLWAALMTAHYGPTGLHAAYRDSDDRPDLSKMSAAVAAQVKGRMDEAVERINRWLDPSFQGWVVRF